MTTGTYKDAANDPLTQEERDDIYRKTSDPLSLHEDFIHWLNVKYIDEFKPPPHGAQLEADENWTNPSSALNVVEFQHTNHDTNAYIVGSTFVIPGIPTLKLSGVYCMSVDLTFDATDFGDDAYVGIYRNDVPIAIQSLDPALKTVSLCVVRRLNEEDVIDVRAFKDAGTQVILASDDAYIVKPVFNIALLYLLDNGEEEEVIIEPPCNPPVNTVAPALNHTGDVFIGSSHTCGNGTWTGDATITYAFQWYWQNEGAGPFVAISGANTNAITLSDYAGTLGGGLDPGDKVKCVVTATNDCDSVDADSNILRIVAE